MHLLFLVGKLNVNFLFNIGSGASNYLPPYKQRCFQLRGSGALQITPKNLR